ncbi:MAG TPA: phosphopentomutase [Lentisphaeria bacterium]|nr:MAG: phosphopentomutase [Lentisphaerae bacterium GWF2_38_69]HBM15371.1 phosphopentomutase [Lentisphaeria bacterium]
MKRTVIIILDSFGVGCAKDSDKYGDTGSDTLGHIVDMCLAGTATGTVKRGKTPLTLPNLARLGLQKLAEESRGKALSHGLGYNGDIEGAYGYGIERSKGKDTPSGHWEIAGVPVMFDWGYFPKTKPTFPIELTRAFIERTKVPGILGDKHASGTEILDELGEEHIRTGKPIVYTSADSVYQIACHEKHFGLDKLYEICDIAREILNEMEPKIGCIGRVIARPFIGESKGHFTRTGNRHDIAVKPPEPTLLDLMKEQGGQVVSIGKIADIFADCGITKKVKATGIDALFETTMKELSIAGDKTIIFTNFVDYDASFGHRRDVSGYAWALEHFDELLPRFEKALQPGDLVIIAADHGCDPTWKGTDHTREHIPIIMFGPEVKAVNIGGRQSFADIGQTIAKHHGLPKLNHGTACNIF